MNFSQSRSALFTDGMSCFCHPERMSRSPERSEGEGSGSADSGDWRLLLVLGVKFHNT